jgi:hypothetical protein
VQILASALPGFRDLRAPLLAGYLWLVFLWILIKPDFTSRPHNVIAAAVYDLAKDAGPIWVGLGVGVAAYLVGSVSQGLSPLLSPLPGIVEYNAVWQHLPKSMQDKLTIPRLSPRKLQEDEKAQLVAGARIDLSFLEARQGLEAEADPLEAELKRRLSKAHQGLVAELQLPATLLLTERGKEPEPQLFSEADRFKAERDLRLAVVPPLSAIAIFLGWNQSWWWWLALIPVGILLWQAHNRNLDFRSLMFGAFARGLVRSRSRSVEEFRRWVESISEPSPDEKAATDAHHEALAPSAEESQPGGQDAP